MKLLMALISAARKLPPSVLSAAVEFLQELVKGDRGQAKRKAEEALRRQAFHEAMKRLKG